jgi:hypothetical protein
MGIATQLGMDTVLHTLTANQQVNPHHDTLKLDFKNAFQNISRLHALTECQKVLPKMYKFVYQCYNSSNKMWYKDDGKWESIDSIEGARQGDPLGTLMFCLGSLQILSSLKEKLNLNSLSMSYIDDLTIQGTTEQIMIALNHIMSQGEQYGLHVNLKKTKVLIGIKSGKEIQSNTKSYLSIFTTKYEDNIISTDANSKDTANDNYGMEILGTPFGSNLYIQEWINDKRIKIILQNEIITKLQDPQIQWLYIYYIIQNKMTHLLRTIPPHQRPSLPMSLNDLIYSQVNDIVKQELTHSTISQLHLPISHAGFGLTNYETASIPAYFASTIGSLANMSDILPTNTITYWKEQLSQYTDDYLQLLPEVQQQIPSQLMDTQDQHETPVISSFNDIITYLNQGTNAKNQKRLMKLTIPKFIEEHENFIEEEDNNSKIHYMSTKHKSSGRWLLTKETKLFTHSDFGTAFKSRLNLPIFNTSTNNPTYCLCSKLQFDSRCNHLLACNNVPKDNNLTKRHNAIVDIIRNMCRDARLNPTLEPTNLFTDISTSTSAHPQQPNAKRPDIMIPSSPIHNHATVILDITIPHPTQDEHVIKTLPKCNIKNKNYLSYKMEMAYRLKEKHYEKEANQYNLQVIPIVLDTHGAFHPELDKLIKQCSNAISQDKGLSTHNINHYWTTTISSTLQSWNTRILRERLTRVHDQSSKSADELDRTYDMEME